jgi:hypothetical protein
MKPLFDFALDRLAQQKFCPCCGWSRTHFVCAGMHSHPEEHGFDHFMNPDDKAAARFGCGSEFTVDETDQIVARQACGQPSTDAADAMQGEADDAFGNQKDAP